MFNRLNPKTRIKSMSFRNILVGGFFLATGTILLLIPAVGYFIQEIRAGSNAEESKPEFTQWKSLVDDGLIGFSIWMLFSLPVVALFILFENVIVVSTDNLTVPTPFWADTIVTAIIDFVGVGIGAAGGSSRNIKQMIGGVGELTNTIPPASVFGSPHEIDVYLLVTYFGVFMAVQYLIPGALANFAENGTFSAGLNLLQIVPRVFQLEYLKNWIRAFVRWSIGASLFVIWNAWRSEVPEGDWYTYSFAFLRIVDVPTTTGVISTTSVYLAGIISFVLLARGYNIIGSTWKYSETTGPNFEVDTMSERSNG